MGGGMAPGDFGEDLIKYYGNLASRSSGNSYAPKQNGHCK